MKHADVLAVLKAHGVDGRKLADIDAHLHKRRAGESTECMACRSKSLKGDFACGRCSAVKADREAKFWEDVSDRENGGRGRVILKRPDPKKIHAVNFVTPAPQRLKVWSIVIDVKEKMVVADAFFTRRISRLVEAVSPEDARSKGRMLTGFYPVAVEEVA